MPAALVTSPPPVAFDANDITVELQSTLFSLGRSSLILQFANRPNDSEAITIEWENEQVIMTAATAPDLSGNEFPATGGATIAEYVDLVAEAFLQNEIFATTVEIQRGQAGGVEELRLRWPQNQIVTVSETNNLTNVTTVINNFAGNGVENLRGLLRVYKVQNFVETFVGALHANYSPSTLRSAFDLKDVLCLSPHVPDVATIGLNSFAVNVARDAFARYCFRYADKYGVPARAEALIKSPDFHVIHGALSSDTLGTFFAATRELLCHNYEIIGTDTLPKIVDHDQPDWLYFYSKAPNANSQLFADLEWSDGTTTTVTIDGDVDLAENTLYYFPSGFRQLGLHNEVNGDEVICRYSLRMEKDPAGGFSIIPLFNVTYELNLDQADIWSVYLLMFNGVGGCESVALQGKTIKKYIANWQRTEKEDSALSNELAAARHRFDLATGWHEQPYIDHLRQLLTGQLWLIDVENNRFIELVMETNSFDVSRDDNDPELNALTFEVSFAKENLHYNNF